MGSHAPRTASPRFLPVSSSRTVLGWPSATRLTSRSPPSQAANTERWSSVMALATGSSVFQTYTSGPPDPSEGRAVNAKRVPSGL